MPGNESDGNGVNACVNSTPLRTRRASAERGCVWTNQTRSDWCRPSTESNNTCLVAALREWALAPPAVTVTAAIAARLASAPRVRTRFTETPFFADPLPRGHLG